MNLKERLKRLLKLRAEKNGLALKVLADAEKEGRMVPTEDEKALHKSYRDEVAAIDEQIEETKRLIEDEERQAEEDRETPESRRIVVTREDGHDEQGESRKFKTFGEQLIAIRNACIPGGRIDPRLETRAPSGAGETVPSDGGFLVQTDFSQEVMRRSNETSILAPRCRRVSLSTGANSIVINGIDESSRVDGSRWGGIASAWTNEADALAASKPKFYRIQLNLHKLTGLFYATEEIMADASVAGSLASEGFAEEFGYQVDAAVLRGDGAGKPLGILSSGCLVTVSKESGPQTADTIVYANVLKMYARMHPRSLSNAVWLVNQDCTPQLNAMYLATGSTGVPVYLPAGGATDEPFARLFGRPVIPVEQCSTLGDLGDILFVDLSQYVLADKGAMQAASSMHVRFVNDEQAFRFTYRCDGQPMWRVALTPAYGSNTLSPFITLEAR